jgi:uncharacterized caspase-like protein
MSQRLKVVFAAILIIATGLFALAAKAQQPASNPRIALVVGNATYRDAALATPANDAGLVAQTLQAAGFDVVGARDLDGQSLRTAFRDFLQKAAAAGPDMQAFVYLAGRAVQYNGDNYFVPVDAQINRDADVPIEALRIADFSHALAATPGRARIIVLDAARANPYATQGSPLAPGLALVDPERGELIAFNAAPGTLAGDEEGPYGVYGKTLAGAIRQGGIDIVQAFDQTRVSVNSETQGALLPWSASKLDGPFYVFERAADAPPPALAFAQTERRPISSFSAEDAYSAAVERDTLKGYREFLAAYPNSDQARRVRAILAVRREAAYWRRTVGADTPRAYWTYLHTYPKGPHIPDARRRLAMLSAEFEPPADFRPEAFADLPPPPPDELVYEDQPIYAFDDFGPPRLASAPAACRNWRAPGAGRCDSDRHWRGRVPARFSSRRYRAARAAAVASGGLRAAAAPRQHQTGGAATAGCRRRRRRSCRERGGCETASANRTAWPAWRTRRGSRQTWWRAASARADSASCCSSRSCRPGPSAQAASGPASGGQCARRAAVDGGCEAGPGRCGAGRSQRPSRSCNSGRKASANSWRAARGCCCAGRSDCSGRQTPADSCRAAGDGDWARRSNRSRRQASASRSWRQARADSCRARDGDFAGRSNRARRQASASRRGRKALADSCRPARRGSSGRQTGASRGGSASGSQSGRVACPGLKAGAVNAGDCPGAQAERGGQTRDGDSARSGSSAGSSGAARASSGACGYARPPCARGGPSRASSCAASGSRARAAAAGGPRAAAGGPRPPAACSCASPCASSAAAGGSSAAAGRATAGMREAWIAAVPEVELGR